jgi:hypothetical protein
MISSKVTAVRVHLAGLCVVLIIWVAGCSRKAPELTRAEASALISNARHFNESRELVSVGFVGTGAPSERNNALVKFSFREKPAKSSEREIQAMAKFQYFRGAWRLEYFRYGEGLDGVAVEVDQ